MARSELTSQLRIVPKIENRLSIDSPPTLEFNKFNPAVHRDSAFDRTIVGWVSARHFCERPFQLLLRDLPEL